MFQLSHGVKAKKDETVSEKKPTIGHKRMELREIIASLNEIDKNEIQNAKYSLDTVKRLRDIAKSIEVYAQAIFEACF